MDGTAMLAALDRARGAGARAAELLHEVVSTDIVEGQRGRAVARPTTTVERLELRLWLDGGRCGSAVGEVAELPALVARATAQAALAPEDRWSAPVVRQSGTSGGLGILDRRAGQLRAADRAEIVVGVEQQLRRVDRRLVVTEVTYREQRRTRRYRSSRGTALEESDGVFGAVARCASADGSTWAISSSSRSFAGIASVPFGTELGRRALRALGPLVKVPAGPVRVVLPPSVVGRLFAWFAHFFRHDDRAAGVEWWPRSFDARLHLQDDGTLPGGLRTASFDDRGAPPRPLLLLREGRPDGAYLDPEQANRLGTQPTGHVFDGRLRPSNLILRAGGRSVHAALADLGGRVLVVDELDPACVDRSTGRVDAVVDALVQDGGEPVGSLRRVRLTGSLAEVLGRLVEVCSDTDRVDHVDAPALIVDGLSLA